MTGPHVIPFLPAFIPVEVCDTVGMAVPAGPDGVDQCMAAVQADVADDGVSAPADVAALREVVSDARQEGIDLKIVVLPKDPGIDTPLRDIATQVGADNPSSTVLVISPSFAGTYSTTIDRVTLEAGQDVAKSAGNPVQASQSFVEQVTTPIFPWTAWTLVLVAGVAAAAVLTRVLQVRGKRGAVAAPSTSGTTETVSNSNIGS